MLRESMDELGETYGLDVRPQREPELGFSTQWIQAIENQKALSDCFCDHIKPEESLCFFYAKQVPFVEDAGARRILVGVGRVLHVSPGVEYQYSTRDLKGKLRSMLWERMVQHSIRPDLKMASCCLTMRLWNWLLTIPTLILHLSPHFHQMTGFLNFHTLHSL
jgi:hypothetical protein